jgi:stearoyl-CoA desaturase (delta-9 desaturase)
LEAIFIGTAASVAALVATELYCHRDLAHRAVVLHPHLRIALDVLYRALVGTDPRAWAIVHRRHHRMADTHGDPHSPAEHGLWTVLLLSGVLFRRARPHGLPKQRLLAAGGHLTRGAIIALLLLCVSVPTVVLAVVIHAATYLFVVGAINSLGHAVGGRPFPETPGTNVPWTALLLFGQSYQNNHHHRPEHARMGRFDPLYPVLVVLDAIHLAEIRGR